MKAKILASTAVLATAAVAAADSVEMRFIDSGPGRNVTVRVDGEQYRLHAGQLNHEVLASTGPTAPGVGMLTTYCVDVSEWVSRQGQTYDVSELTEAPVGENTDGMSQGAADAIGRLYAHADGEQFENNRNFSAAFQIAIWEIVADFDGSTDGLDVDDGSFRAWSLNSSTRNHLATLLAIAGDESLRINRRIRALTNDGAQDQMYEVVIPLPTTGAMAAVGLAGAGFMARRRRKDL